MGVPVERVDKIAEGSSSVVDLIGERRCDLVINTPTGSGARADGQAIRTAAVRHGIPCPPDGGVTCPDGAGLTLVRAFTNSVASLRRPPPPVASGDGLRLGDRLGARWVTGGTRQRRTARWRATIPPVRFR